MTLDNQNYLKNYSGNNNFILSLQRGFTRYGTLTEKQESALNRFIENEKKTKTTITKEKEENMAKKKDIETSANFVEESDESQQGLFSIETLDENLPPNPMFQTNSLDYKQIEDQLTALAGRVVEDTMRQASKKLDAIVQKANLVASNRPVMHVKLAQMPVVALSQEAHTLLPKILTGARLGLNTLLIGPAGCGKTTLAAQVAESLQLPFGHLCLSAGVSETWLYGRQLPSGIQEGEFSKFYRNGGVFLLDEFDAADSNLLLSINTALANGHLYNPILGEKIERHKDFVCIAAANTFGLGGNAQYTGRNRLDAATLDRFLQFSIEYNTKLEKKLCPDDRLYSKLVNARKELEKRNAVQVISTRAFDRGYRLLSSGFSLEDVIQTITLSWPKGLADEIGLQTKSNSEEIPF